MLGSGICSKVLHEIPRLKTSSGHKIKTEVAHLLLHLLKFTDKEEHVKYLVKEDILGILNQELMSNANSPKFMVLAIECLGYIFSKVPDMKNEFLKNYGPDVFEKCQHGNSDDVYDATIKLLDEHFECQDEIIEEEDQNPTDQAFNI